MDAQARIARIDVTRRKLSTSSPFAARTLFAYSAPW
jgi:hypothetical protein